MLVKVFERGDLFSSQMQTLVNPVNAPPDGRGVMGAGLAREFARRFPDLEDAYHAQLGTGRLRMGRPCLWKGDSHWVLNFPTKVYWWDDSDSVGIQAGLGYLATNYVRGGITGLAIPALGCGLGNLPWATVQAWLLNFAERVTIPVEVYAPQ